MDRLVLSKCRVIISLATGFLIDCQLPRDMGTVRSTTLSGVNGGHMGVRVQQQAASQSGAVRVSLALAGAGPRISASPARGCLALHCMLCYRHEHAVLALVDLITLRPCPPTSENGRLYTCAIAIT